jgi:asparagine synthase (glutamine-hydrolysing)
LQRYWTPEPSREIRLASDAAYAEAVRALLQQAVHDRVRTVVPVGAHVSGGLDSSAVVCVAAARLRESAQSLTGFTWSWPPEATDDPQEGELPFIAAVCAYAGLTLHSPQSTLEAMRDALTMQCGPLGIMPLSAQIMAMHDLVHAQGVRVLLSGVGGDEVASFNGRGYWAALAQQGRWLSLARELAWSRQRNGTSWRHTIVGRVVEPLLPATLWRLYHRALGRQMRDQPLEWSCIQPALAHRLGLEEQLRRTALRVGPGVRTNQLQFLLHGNLVTRMEEWGADAARWGLDYRYPLLDRRLLEFCLALPPEQYVRQGWTRYLFRRTIEALVPASLPWQRDKHDPVSERHNATQRARLWPLLRQPLAQYAQNLAVHTYVDIPRMQAHLEELCALTAPVALPPVRGPSKRFGFFLALMTAAFVHRYGSS